jgi:cytochrome c2
MVKKKRMKILPALLGVAFWSLAFPPQGDSSPEDASKGKAIFEGRCAACHTIGEGVRVGPDLKGITDLRPTAWLTQFISNPGQMVKSRDPVANDLLKKFGGLEMPTLGLSTQEVTDVLAYLRSSSALVKAQAPQLKAQTPLPSAPAPAPPVQAPAPQAPGPAGPALAMGPAEVGKQLFTGLVTLEKGGPPCISCHDVASIPFPGGGTLGPDLTGVFAKFGATGMNSILATLSFPTMKPIFDQRPLTLPEQQDLEAFLQKAGVQSLISRGVQIGMAGLGGFIILIIAVWIIWQNRPGNVRKALVRSVRSSD